MKMQYVQYKCTKCGATDSDKLFPHEKAAAVVNCWKCHAGLNVPRDEQLMTQTGMVFQGANS